MPGAPPRPSLGPAGRGQTRLRAGGVRRTVRSRPWAALRARGRNRARGSRWAPLTGTRGEARATCHVTLEESPLGLSFLTCTAAELT